MGEGSGRGSGRVGSGQTFCRQSRVGLGRVNVSPGRVGSKKSDPWTTLIRRIRHLLPLSAATALANSLVSSKLDYCNSLYNGISQANLNKIQRIQNTLARVVTHTSKFEQITPILKKLHWLQIKQRIDYKLCLLTYKTLQIQQPTYLYYSLSFPSHSLSTRSSDSSVLSIPYVRTSLGKIRAFSVIAPRLWNSLPPDTRNSLSVSTFRSKLKTHFSS